MADATADIFGLDKVDTPSNFQTLNFDDIFELVVNDNVEVLDSELAPPLYCSAVQSAGIGGSKLSKDEPDARVETSKKYKPLPILRSEKCSPLSQTPVERAKYDYYPCFIDITSANGGLKDDFNSILTLFGTPLMFQVRPDPPEPVVQEPTPGDIPRFIIQLRLEMRLPGTTNRYEKLKAALTKDSWTKVERSKHKIDNTQLYVHKHCPGVGLGVELTSLTSSIRYLLTVKGQKALDQATSFYDRFLRRQPTQTNDPAIYELTKHCEFLIRLENEGNVSPADSLSSLCFVLPSLPDNMDFFSLPDERGWCIAVDPEGNIVHIKCNP